MNYTPLNRGLGLSWLALLLLLPQPRAFAVMGVGDSTIIVGDLTDALKWPRELAQWTALIQNTEQEIARADELIRMVGDPEKMVHELVDSVPDLLKPVDDAVGLETRLEALKTSKERYGLGSVAIQTYNDANKVDSAYEMFGEKVKRDAKRYTHLQMQEAMYARYKKAVQNAEAVEKKEVGAQRKALEGLSDAQSASEVAVFNGLIAASKQRLDLAQQKALQVKAELDAFRGQMLVEESWKAEADREWAQAVIDRMRAKALESYQAQVGGGTLGAGN